MEATAIGCVGCGFGPGGKSKSGFLSRAYARTDGHSDRHVPILVLVNDPSLTALSALILRTPCSYARYDWSFFFSNEVVLCVQLNRNTHPKCCAAPVSHHTVQPLQNKEPAYVP